MHIRKDPWLVCPLSEWSWFVALYCVLRTFLPSEKRLSWKGFLFLSTFVLVAFSHTRVYAGFTDTRIVDGGSSETISTTVNHGTNDVRIGDTGVGAVTFTTGAVITTGIAYIGDDAGSSGNVVLEDTATWTMGDSKNLYVGNIGNGSLVIKGGADLVVGGHAYLGHNSASTSYVEVTGSGSTMTLTRTDRDIYGSNDGDLRMVVSDGAYVFSNRHIRFGDNNLASTNILIDGAGTEFATREIAYIPVNGSTEVVVQNGAVLDVDDVHMANGNNTNTQGRLIVRGAGSRVEINNYFRFRHLDCWVVVEDGGYLEAKYTWMGDVNGYTADRHLTVRDEGSIIDAGNVYLGYHENATIYVEGGEFIANYIDAGFQSSAQTTAIQLSGGALKVERLYRTYAMTHTFNWTGGDLYVRRVETTFPNITNSAGTLNVGVTDNVFARGEFNAYTVSSAAAGLVIELGGTTWSQAGTKQYDRLDVTGSFTINGVLEVEKINGFEPVAEDTFDILDWGSKSGTFAEVRLPTLNGTLYWELERLYTHGEIKVIDELFKYDGLVDNGEEETYTSANNVDLTTFFTYRTLDAQIGVTGNGILNINSNGTAKAVDVYIGRHAGSAGTVNVSSASSIFTSTDDTFIGYEGRGELNLSSGADWLVTDDFYAVDTDGASAYIYITGSGSFLDLRDFAYFGNADGEVRISVSEGEIEIDDDVYFANSFNSSVNVTLSSSAMLDINNPLFLARLGDVSMEVLSGADVDFTNQAVQISYSNQSRTDLLIDGSGSTFTGSGAVAAGVSGDVFITVSDGATFTAGNTELADTDASYVEFDVNDSGTQVNINGTFKVADAGFAVVTQNNGTVDISSTMTLASQTGSIGRYFLVDGLLEANSIQAGSGSYVFKLMGGELQATTIGFDILNEGSVLNPHTTYGTLTISGDYTQYNGATYKAELSSASTYDKLSVQGDVQLNGALNVEGVSFTPVAGNEFDILDWTGSLSGQFSSLSLPSLSGTNEWVTVNLYLDGTIKVHTPFWPGGSTVIDDPDVPFTFDNQTLNFGTSTVQIGQTSEGILQLINDSVMTTGVGNVGYYSGSYGSVTLAGENTLWTLTRLYMGRNGTGELIVRDGARLQASDHMYFANGTTSEGNSIRVTGAGSEIVMTNTSKDM